MSDEHGTPADNTATPPPALYVAVQQDPSGAITSVDLTRYAFDAPEVFADSIRSTVWSAELPGYGDNYAPSTKILDLSLSTLYQDQDPKTWVDGERLAHSFRYDLALERTYLRTVESHLIRAGYTNAYTGMVACQRYGIILAGAYESHAYKGDNGWYFNTENYAATDGWEEYPEPIAPLNASPRRLAAAILRHIGTMGDIEPAELRTLAGLRLRLALLAITPHWANLKYRARQIYDRRRNRVTVRIPR